MSSIGGNYNFGVWNPPTGLDSVKYSQSINFNLAVKLNNLQTEKKQEIKQFFNMSLPKFNYPDMDLVFYLNDSNLKVFTGMIRQGWGR